MQQSPWTEDRIADLRKFAAMNLSCNEIAAALGTDITRNAVIGRMHRMGLTNGNSKGKQTIARPRKDKVGKRIIVRPRRKTTYGGEVQVLPLLPFVDLPDERIPIDQRKTIVELDNETCRWPCGDPGSPEFFYCGSPQANNATGIPYCRAHTLRACAKTVAPSIAPRRAAA